MAKKLWGGRFAKTTDPAVEKFSRSVQYDYKLAEYDVIGSLVHVRILQKAGYLTEGAMLGSDAFFPMPDSIEIAAKHKIKAIIQPGGSIRDADVIAACDQAGIAMAFTGERHFKH